MQFYFEKVCFVCLAHLRGEGATLWRCRETSHSFWLCTEYCCEVYKRMDSECALMFEAERVFLRETRDKRKVSAVVAKLLALEKTVLLCGNLKPVLWEFVFCFASKFPDLIDADKQMRVGVNLMYNMYHTRRYAYAKAVFVGLDRLFGFEGMKRYDMDMLLSKIMIEMGEHDEAFSLLINTSIPPSRLSSRRVSLEGKIFILMRDEEHNKAKKLIDSIPIVFPNWSTGGENTERSDVARFAADIMSHSLQLGYEWKHFETYADSIISLAKQRKCACDQCLHDFAYSLYWLTHAFLFFGKKGLFPDVLIELKRLMEDSNNSPHVDVNTYFYFSLALLNEEMGRMEDAIDSYMNCVAIIKHKYICDHPLYWPALKFLEKCCSESSPLPPYVRKPRKSRRTAKQ